MSLSTLGHTIQSNNAVDEAKTTNCERNIFVRLAEPANKSMQCYLTFQALHAAIFRFSGVGPPDQWGAVLRIFVASLPDIGSWSAAAAAAPLAANAAEVKAATTAAATPKGPDYYPHTSRIATDENVPSPPLSPSAKSPIIQKERGLDINCVRTRMRC